MGHRTDGVDWWRSKPGRPDRSISLLAGEHLSLNSAGQVLKEAKKSNEFRGMSVADAT